MLNTDYYMNAGDDLHIHVALLFSAILVHVFSPEEFCTSTVNPIPKGCNVNHTDSAKLRTFVVLHRALCLSQFLIILYCKNIMIISLLQNCNLVSKRKHSTHVYDDFERDFAVL